MVCKHFLPFQKLSFLFVWCIFAVQKLFHLMDLSYLFLLVFFFNGSFGIIYTKSLPLPWPILNTFLSIFYSSSFVCCFRSYLNLYIIQVKFSSIHVQMNIQFSKWLTEETIFPAWTVLPPLSTISGPYMDGLISWLSIFFHCAVCF